MSILIVCLIVGAVFMALLGWSLCAIAGQCSEDERRRGYDV